MATKAAKVQATFFDYLFGLNEGYLCICTLASGAAKAGFRQHFFEWPIQKQDALAFIERVTLRNDVWFCTSLLEGKRRKKEYCLPNRLVWADLDKANPDDIEPSPSIVIQSSPGHWQALWRLDKEVPPEVSEEFSKKIAYRYSNNGADKSGHDLTQLLRVPLTHNYKYESAPEVLLLKADDELIPTGEFEAIEWDEPNLNDDDLADAPDPDEVGSVENIVYKYQAALNRTGFKDLFFVEPAKGEDWSHRMYHLLNICVEAGMTKEEAFVIGLNAACNKYRRDSRPMIWLWREVLKVDLAQKRINLITGHKDLITMPSLVPVDSGSECFVDQYVEWGQEATDAPSQFHELGAVMVLSALLGSNMRLATNAAVHRPNIWGLVLGKSTITRKTTSMNMAMNLISEVDSDALLASDGSAEGLLTGLSSRPNKTSVFYKDEVSGFFESINRKDYLAGMPETLTLLYDCPAMFPRLLRKEVITITNPYLIFFGGGIRDKVYDLVTEQYIISGFLPRFIVISGENEIEHLRPMGPPTEVVTTKREVMAKQLKQLYGEYHKQVPVTIGSNVVIQDVLIDVELEPAAWDLFREIDFNLMKAGAESAIDDVAVPTFVRLGITTLKVAMLLAAYQDKPRKNKVKVKKADVINSARFTQKWGLYATELLRNAGKGANEKLIDKIMQSIRMNPGCTRSVLMNKHHLYKRDADHIFQTIEERGLVVVKTEGKGKRFTAI